MNTRIATLFSTLLVVMLVTGCGFQIVTGSGTVVTEERSVGDFTRVDFTGFGELTLVQGDHEALTVETDDNLLPYIKTTVSKGALTIGFARRIWLPLVRPTQSIHYRLTAKTLTQLDFSGAGTVTAATLHADNLTVVESGAAEINLTDLTANALTIKMSGSGSVGLAGKVTTQTVDLSGLGSYAAGDLASQSAQINLSGVGEATLWVHEQLDAEMSGAGTIRYYGSPQVNASSSGIGAVQRLADK
ncbi:MAG: head GIN domain-containing protein [Caldilineaceae bacterium]